ncbi:MAG: hypothetical protein IH840_06115 [Candidatus Heimdallarchaeota archaeon]|nr:hypothetical protein [Candidatus Heimdallarchaeota archaeon]
MPLRANPVETVWIINQGETGYNNLQANIFEIQVTSTSVVVLASGIPDTTLVLGSMVIPPHP